MSSDPDPTPIDADFNNMGSEIYFRIISSVGSAHIPCQKQEDPSETQNLQRFSDYCSFRFERNGKEKELKKKDLL